MSNHVTNAATPPPDATSTRRGTTHTRYARTRPASLYAPLPQPWEYLPGEQVSLRACIFEGAGNEHAHMAPMLVHRTSGDQQRWSCRVSVPLALQPQEHKPHDATCSRESCQRPCTTKLAPREPMSGEVSAEARGPHPFEYLRQNSPGVSARSVSKSPHPRLTRVAHGNSGCTAL